MEQKTVTTKCPNCGFDMSHEIHGMLGPCEVEEKKFWGKPIQIRTPEEEKLLNQKMTEALEAITCQTKP